MTPTEKNPLRELVRKIQSLAWPENQVPYATAIEQGVKLIEESELMKAVCFYADSFTWVSNSGKIGINPIDSDCENIPGSSGAMRRCGGKMARDTLAAMKGGKA